MLQLLRKDCIPLWLLLTLHRHSCLFFIFADRRLPHSDELLKLLVVLALFLFALLLVLTVLAGE
jgi:hypothetical protein